MMMSWVFWEGEHIYATFAGSSCDKDWLEMWNTIHSV